MTYNPPCTVTPAIERLISNICEMVGRLSVPALIGDLRLRRINRIRTIHGSLAIEGNTLSGAQIIDIMEGKRIVAPFVEFMLEAIKEVLESFDSDQVGDQVSDQVKRLIRLMDQGFVSAAEIMAGLGLSHRPTFRKNYLYPAMALNLIEMKYPENPRDPRQRYRLTIKGQRLKALIG